MPTVVLREKTVSYELGEHEAPDDGKRLLFLHGDNGGLSWWKTQLHDFSHAHDTYAVDLPGHGDSTGPQCDSIAGYRDALASFIEGMAIEPAVLVGHSLGALIALSAAAHTPDLVEGLVLVSMYTKWRPRAATVKALAQAVEAGAAAALDQSLMTDSTPEHVQQWVRRHPTRTDAIVLLNDLTAVAQFDVAAELARVSQPTLVIVGAKDPRLPVSEAEGIAAALPNGTLAVIDNAGHLPMIDLAHNFNTALATFLDSL